MMAESTGSQNHPSLNGDVRILGVDVNGLESSTSSTQTSSREHLTVNRAGSFTPTANGSTTAESPKEVVQVGLGPGGQRIQTFVKKTALSRVSSRVGRSLCPQCAELDLTFDNFVIDDRSSAILGRGPNFWGKRRMGNFEDILSKSKECELCQLLVKSMEQRPKSSAVPQQVDPAADCMLFWTVDGRERIEATETTASYTVKRTRRLAIEWQSKTLDIDTSYIVLIAPEGKFLADGTVNPDGEGGERSTFFLGRKLTSLDKANIELVKDWLQLCRKHHHGDCAIDHNNSRFRDLLVDAFFSVVDVEKMCLVGLPDGEEYLALSYTWGGQSQKTTENARTKDNSQGPPVEQQTADQDIAAAPSNQESFEGTGADNKVDSESNGPLRSAQPPDDRFKTTIDNVDDLQMENGIGNILGDLPKAIQNAIALTKYLKFKYIWIDSLCIIQDHEDSWPLNAAKMDIIYGNAELTICAADGDGVDVGLVALFAPRGTANKGLFRPAAKNQIIHRYPTRDPQHPPLELMLSWPSESYVECSRWNNRAWTFQERMISPRCLICVDERLYYQCRTTTMAEDIFSDEATAQGSAGWSVELYGAPAQTLKRLQTDPISVYKHCLRMYTSRQLTFEEDTLSAFAGIGNVITQHLGHSDDIDEDSTLVFGLPASHFDYCLPWQPEEKPQRRVLPPMNGKPNKVVFPSWSWSGWRCNKGVNYRRAAVAGPEINLHEWLEQHTWITWYIRSSSGQLRLVWDPVRYKQNTNVELRWRGYNSPQKGWPTPSNNLEPVCDYHGRPFRMDMPRTGRVQSKETQFQQTIQAFRWKNARMIPPGTKRGRGEDKPYLQFCTWWARFYVRAEPEDEQFVRVVAPAGDGLKRYAILDRHQDFAGTILLDEAWSQMADKSKPQEFIAISDARDFDESEYGYWNLYIEEDQSAVPWQMYNVLMIVRDDEHAKKGDNIAFRRGLGKIYKKAFEQACLECADENGKIPKCPAWKEILLG